MGEPIDSNHDMTTKPNPLRPPPPPPPYPPLKAHRQSSKKKNRPKVFRVVRSVFRSFPVKTKRFPFYSSHFSGGSSSDHVTATLFGYRNGGVSLCIQENPYAFPVLILEMGLETSMLEKEMSMGFVRIVLECENKETMRLVEEPSWTVYCNGKKSGYGVKREATEEDLGVMEKLQPMSTGTGALPGKSDVEGGDCEMAYVRTHFDRVVGSKDSKTLYMVSSDRNNGPELSIFFVRV
ncbi:protein MIZU-KUSSEI 1-like [Cynara cardunculus var. scolymus]|uniref:Protein MIZU-KUSSEI 1 n=1 Tax=Cynara cardunculus var. scolymus TaxID=59895 RepID=A0A124SBB3_CYNCS|nr:protein MIZU-KUSSEI 1-like [Cynara cardunculus var. scolymus]KVH90082.1 Protein of unknown function DUF617, plant [Cynara cardunculus var. scolymus]